MNFSRKLRYLYLSVIPPFNRQGETMRRLLFFAFVAAILTSCGPSEVFTENSRLVLEQQGLSVNDIQFYADKEMIMRREIQKTETSVTRGEIKFVKGERVQEIRIPRGTPGVVEQTADGKLWVAFEQCKGCTLRFVKNSYDSYQVDADKWIEGKGQISYDEKNFYLIPPHNDALLMVKKKELYKPKKGSRTVKGVTIEEKKGRKEKKKKNKVRRKDLKVIDPEAPEESDEELWEDEDGTTNQ